MLHALRHFVDIVRLAPLVVIVIIGLAQVLTAYIGARLPRRRDGT